MKNNLINYQNKIRNICLISCIFLVGVSILLKSSNYVYFLIIAVFIVFIINEFAFNKVKQPTTTKVKPFEIKEENNILKVIGDISGHEKEIYNEILKDGKYIAIASNEDEKNNVKVVAMPMHVFFKPSMYNMEREKGMTHIIIKNENMGEHLTTITLLDDSEEMLNSLKRFGKEIYWKQKESE